MKEEKRKRILRVGCLIPVSYTHLDVYKRQEFKKPESTVVLIRPILDPETGCPNFFSLKANYKIVEPVSYTHLAPLCGFIIP